MDGLKGRGRPGSYGRDLLEKKHPKLKAATWTQDPSEEDTNTHVKVKGFKVTMGAHRPKYTKADVKCQGEPGLNTLSSWKRQ